MVSEMNIRKIVVAGAGQVGTPVVMAVAEKYPDCEIVALDIDPSVEKDFFAVLKENGIDTANISFHNVKTPPDMWGAIFTENRAKIPETAKSFRENPEDLRNAIERNDPAIGDRIKAAHEYAREMPSGNIKPCDLSAVEGSNLRLSAFAGLMSLAITENVRRVEKETGQKISDLANPGLKDGMGPIASTPEAVAELFKTYGNNLAPMLKDFLEQFDTIIEKIETCEYEPKNDACTFIHGVIKKAGNTFKALKNVFTATPRIFRRPVPPKPQPA